jgi:hypothetical protein
VNHGVIEQQALALFPVANYSANLNSALHGNFEAQVAAQYQLRIAVMGRIRVRGANNENPAVVRPLMDSPSAIPADQEPP